MSKSSSLKTERVRLATRKLRAKTPSSTGTRSTADNGNVRTRMRSVTARGMLEEKARATAMERPVAMGTRRTVRSDRQARINVLTASNALPMAPAVVPNAWAARPTVAMSRMVAAR